MTKKRKQEDLEKEQELKGIINDRLSDLIKSRKLIQGLQAKEMGVSVGSLSKYANGIDIPNGLALKKIAEYYNVSADYLLGLSSGSSPNIKEREIVDTLGLSDKSMKTLQFMNCKPKLKAGQIRICGHGRCYDLYLKVFNLLIEYADFDYIIQALHDYLFFNTPKAHFANFVVAPDEKGKKCYRDVPLNHVDLYDDNRFISVYASDLSESILETILISKFRALKKEILEDNLKNVFSLLEREEEKEKIKNTEYKNKREQHLKLSEVESGKYKKN